MDPQNREPIIEETTEQAADKTCEAPVKQPVPVYAERAVTPEPEVNEEELKALALAYAKYLAEQGLVPGEPTFTDTIPEENETDVPAESTEDEIEITAEKKSKNKRKKSASGKSKPSKKQPKRRLFNTDEPSEEAVQAAERTLDKQNRGLSKISAVLDAHDRIQTGFDSAVGGIGRDFVTASHRITSTYRQSRRAIGFALLLTGVLVAVILTVFDKYTVYEYSYNGKVLGYVRSQEDVTDVLDIAGTMMTANSSGDTDISFVANQNVTFKQVDARNKSTDDADTAVNKLVYMTDIETEAYGVYDGTNLEAVVKSSGDAEMLLNQTMDELSVPDDGMQLVSSEFTNDLDIRPVNVLLTSVRSNDAAMELMTHGGSMEIYHIVEEKETIEDLSESFGVDPVNIYNEDNSQPAEEISAGDKVCVHVNVSPVSVEMVETGRMKEIIEFETVKKDSDDYYKGDTYTEQEGVDGIQIFDGTVTKVAGEVTSRDGDVETIREKQDKIILIGTAERPKTLPTGTYAMPIHNYVLTSNFGYRWGRLHAGIDMGAPTGTPIYASDGGTITRAGWYSGYGMCVDIQHESGRLTRYAHCSKILVNVGDKVYQGQNIALVGNTGHSFGSHLHFEINLNGSPVNPRPYLGI